MAKYYTTIEQSNRLVELNIPVDTADMSYRLTTNNAGNEIWELQTHTPYDEFSEIPCWSTEALLKLLPIQTNGYIMRDIHSTIKGKLSGHTPLESSKHTFVE